MTQAVRQHGPGFLAACLAGGLVSGLTGLGGGTVTTPILTAFLGYGQHAAHAASLAAMAGSSAVSAAVYLASGKASAPHAAMLAGVSAIWAVAGASVADGVRPRPLRAMFLAFLAAACLAVLSGFSPTRIRLSDPATHVAASALAGTLAGLLSGLLGVGGGTVFVPVLVVLGFSQQAAQGTSLLAITPSSALAASQYSSAGHISRSQAITAAAASALGAAAGSAIALSLPAAFLKRIFAAFLLTIAARQAAQILRG
jgi:uncharacterized membrane protein YfcA